MTIANIFDYVLTHSKPNKVFRDNTKCLSLAKIARLRCIVVLLYDMEMQQGMV
jgi:hypothetical protein